MKISLGIAFVLIFIAGVVAGNILIKEAQARSSEVKNSSENLVWDD